MTGKPPAFVSERASRLPDLATRAGESVKGSAVRPLAPGSPGLPFTERQIDAFLYDLLDRMEDKFAPVFEVNLAGLVRHELWPMLRPMVREASLVLESSRAGHAGKVAYVSEKAMAPVAGMLEKEFAARGRAFEWVPLDIKVRDDPLPEAFMPFAASVRDTARRGLVARDVPKADAVLFIHSRSHALTASPLLAELARSGLNLRVLARDDNGAFKTLEGEGIAFDSIDRYATREMVRTGRDVRARMRQDAALFDIPPAPDGFDFSPLLRGFARALTEKRIPLLTPLPTAVVEYLTMKRFLSDSGARVLVVFEEHRSVGKGAVAAARAAGIRSLSVQHGNLMENLWFKPFTADVFAVDGPATMGVLKRLGVDERRIRVTGQPRNDMLWKAASSPKGALASVSAAAGTVVKRPLVAITTQPLQDWSARERWVRAAIAGASAGAPGGTVVVKLHPAEEESRYTKWLEATDAVVTKTLDTYALLAACDLAVTYYSMTGLEAAMMGKPVMMLNLSKSRPPIDYRAMGIALEACDETEAADLVAKLLSDSPERRALETSRTAGLREKYQPVDGQASRRVAELLLGMMA